MISERLFICCVYVVRIPLSSQQFFYYFFLSYIKSVFRVDAPAFFLLFLVFFFYQYIYVSHRRFNDLVHFVPSHAWRCSKAHVTGRARYICTIARYIYLIFHQTQARAFCPRKIYSVCVCVYVSVSLQTPPRVFTIWFIRYFLFFYFYSLQSASF